MPSVRAPTTTAATLNHNRRRIKRVMLHVDRSMDRRCRIADLAAEACYAPFHFQRVFAALMGESPPQYVYRKSMERADFMLASTIESTALHNLYRRGDFAAQRPPGRLRGGDQVAAAE